MSAVTHRDHEPVTDALAVMLGGNLDGPLSVFAVGPRGERVVRWARTHQEVSALATAMTDHDVWVGMATRRTKLPGNQRGKTEHCLSIGSLWADVDVVGPNHARPDCCPSMTAAREFVDTVSPLGPPALVIETGGGIHAYWPLAERVAGAEAVALLERWGTYLVGKARERGWHLDNVYDLPRVMRVPGTHNRKGDTPTPVTVVRLADVEPVRASGLTWLPEQAPPQMRALASAAVPYVGPKRPGDAFNAAHTCGDVLAAHGWELDRTETNGDQQWRRPGKRRGQGTSATVYASDLHCLVWTSSVPTLKERGSYDAFGLFARLSHHGDIGAATAALGDLGYGERHDLDLSVLKVAARPEPVDEEAQDAADWPAPQPVVTPDLTPPALDHRYVFGADIAAIIDEIADQVQVPTCAVAQVVLGAFSVIACGRVNVRITDDWVEPAHLQQALVLRSGRAKSPTEAAVMDPVREAERRRAEQTADEVSKRTHERQVAAKRAKEISQLASSNMAELDVQLEMAAIDRILDGPPPEPFRATVQDITPERFVQKLWTHEGRLSIVSPEPEVLATALGAQSGRSQNVSLEVFLKGQDGGWHDVERKGGRESGPTSIRLPRVCVAIMVCAQPGIFKRVRSDETLVDRGFVARLMIVAPPVERIDARKRLRARSTGARQRWAEIVRAHTDRWWSITMPVDIRLSCEAADLHAEWAQPIYDRWDDGDLEPLGGFVAKLTSNVCRVAVLLHLADGGRSGDSVGVEHMRRACAVGDWWLGHALSVWTRPEGQISDDERLAIRLAEWVRERRLDAFTQREAHRMLISSSSGRRIDADDASAAIDAGHKLGWWRADAPVRNTTRNVAVNPGLLTFGDLVSRMSRVALLGGEKEERPLTPSPTPHVHSDATRDTRDNPATASPPQVHAENSRDTRDNHADPLADLGGDW